MPPELAGGFGRKSFSSLPVSTRQPPQAVSQPSRHRRRKSGSPKMGDYEMRNRRVLVIDDDRMLCELIRTTFELEGFDVDTAYDVIEAERVLVESRPDAILLDIGLPGIDGIFYLERLRETPNTRKIPIVAISGSEEAGRSARAVGAEAFLRKPFSPLEL